MTDENLNEAAEIASIFAVPLAQVRLADYAPLNAQLRRLLLAREAMPSVANPTPSLRQQPGVFESQFDLFSWPDAPIRRLRDFCWRELGRTVAALNGYSADDMARLRIYSHTWFHVTRSPGFVIAHTHPMASWSGVYCVDAGGSSGTHTESGVLRFQNPHYYSNMFLDPGNARLQAPFHHGTWSMHLQPGQLVLFPSWVQHEVLPFFGEGERITIAFNCWFAMKGETA